MMWLRVGVYFLLLDPLILLAVVWRGLLSGRTTRFARAVAGLVSLSHGYLLTAFLFKAVVLGPDYGDRLFLTAQLNTGFAFVLFVVAILRKYPGRGPLACAALAVSVGWFYVLAINTAV
jgi:hypothetical protein